MLISDDQLDTAQAAISQRTQELIPEHLRLAGLDGDAQNFASPVQIDRHRNCGSDTDDASGASDFDAGGIRPEIGPFAFQWPLEEGFNASVDLDAQARDLALGDAGHAHRLYQIIDRLG